MPDPVTGDRERFARAALLEITGADAIGDLISETVETDTVVTIHFASLLAGYPGWHWSVSLAELPGEAPSVLEVELMPGEGALLSPEWVPWSDRIPGADDEVGEDEDEEDDDLDPDEIDDGIDFETDDDPDTDDPDPDLADEAALVDSAAVPPVGVEQRDEPEPEPDEDRPEPPGVPAVKKRWQRKKKSAEGE